MDEKMKKMGEMQLSSVTDAKKKKTILDQVTAISVLSAALSPRLSNSSLWLPRFPALCLELIVLLWREQ